MVCRFLVPLPVKHPPARTQRCLHVADPCQAVGLDDGSANDVLSMAAASLFGCPVISGGPSSIPVRRHAAALTAT